jgi:tetratricopeptide (TPR) repeat protein
MPLPDLQEPLSLLERKDFGTAVEVLEEKVSALPAHLGAHVLLAHAHEAQEHWEDALEAWANAHFLMPNSPIAKAGKKRVLQRMDGITGDGEHPPIPEAPAALSPGLTESPSEPETEAPSSDEVGDSSSEDDFGLAQLRRQAEREARQGGARPGLADEPPTPPSPDEPTEESSSTPEEQIEHLDEGEEADDLDRLIDKLQSARIDPDPEAEMSAPPPTPEDSDDPSAGDEEEHDPADEVVSETLAKIHEGQNDYEKAAHIYAQLAEQEPERADEFRAKAAEMREKTDGADEDT